ncbi:MAG: LCP family protein [Lachnospiraceae bacterium]|nr:LCP family protein [Lachnospiraceae bacterium]
MREDDRNEERLGSHKKYGKGSRKKASFAWRILPLLQLILTVVLAVQVYMLNMLTVQYLGIAAVALVVLAVIPWILTSLRSRASRIIGTVIALIATALLALGNYYLYQTSNTLEEITGTTTVTQTEEVVIVVLDKSEFESLTDLDGKTVGIQSVLDRDNTDQALEQLNSNLDNGVETTEYTGMGDMVQALYDEEVSAILFSESYRDMITDEYETFDTDTRILDTYTYETVVEVTSEGSDKEVDSEPFIVYFSGIDTYGSVAAKSRSDVNIMAVVNPQTKQILLVTTPRDYYVCLPFGDDCMDKLTHAGIYGIDCSIETLENLYGIDIDYYVRMNFTGFVDIVDALGGVSVYSSQSFSTSSGYSFSEGYNTVDGTAALAFVRERKAFAEGDNQRGKNQMAMITAIIEKIASPSILSSYSSLLSSLEGSFTTDMSSDNIASLVKMQLADNADWTVQSYAVSGTGSRASTYSMGSTQLYVTLQDEESIATAQELIAMVQNGETIDESLVE